MFYQLRKLNDPQSKELNEWLKEHNIQLSKQTRSEFSDAIEVAKLLKSLHSTLIHLSQYTKSDDDEEKLLNWQIFNEKVLTKLNLAHTKCSLQKLAKGKVGAIESLIYDLISTKKSRLRSVSEKAGPPSCKTAKTTYLLAKSLTHIPVESLVLNVDQMINGKIDKVAKKHVAYEDYMKALRQCEAKDNYINYVQKSAQHLLDFTTENHKKIMEFLEQV